MIGTALKKAWIPLLILAVALVAGFTVQRVRGYFGQNPVIVTPRNFADDAKPFKPKVVTYEITG
ncbi:MmpS family transport accessory protein, partial [Mycolicibacterium llatzerense]